MATEVRTRLTHADRRQQLLELAVEVFGARAFDDVSMDELAELAGVSKALLYHYFPTKGDYFVAAVEHTSGQVFASAEPDRSLPPEQVLEHSVDGFLRWVEANRRAYWMWTRGGLGVDPRVSQIIAAHQRAAVDRLLAGHRGDPMSELEAYGWLGFLDAIALKWLDAGWPLRRQVLALALSALPGAVKHGGHQASRSGDGASDEPPLTPGSN